MAEALKEKENKSPRKFWPLLVGVGGSTLWGLFTLQYFFRNYAEIFSLSSNSLGDVLAGFFAPLAFLWLFVATLLQRQELELQRLELTETREVLAQQKAEMERAANETLEQTKIMKENLANDLIRKEYDQIDTLLYTTALFIFTNRYAYNLVRQDSETLSFIVDYELKDFEISKISFDGVYSAINNSLRRCAETLQRDPLGWRAPSAYHEKIALETYRRLTQIEQFIRGGNLLVLARLTGLNFSETTQLFKSVQQFKID